MKIRATRHKGLFLDNDCVALSGVVESSHFFDTTIVLSGPVKFIECTFEASRSGLRPFHNDDGHPVQLLGCLFVGPDAGNCESKEPQDA